MMRAPKDLRKIKLVIFDLDGTLVNAYPAIVQSFNFMRKKFGWPPVGERAIRRAVGWGDRNLLKPFVEEKYLEKALSIYRKHHAVSLVKKTRFLPGGRQLLRKLQGRGYLLAVASNRPTRFSHIILRSLRIERYFDYILCGDKIQKAKPHPDILLAILKRFSLESSQAVYVGDMTVDIEAGNRAKITTIAATGGSSSKKELAQLKPYKIVDKVFKVYNIVERLNLGR